MGQGLIVQSMGESNTFDDLDTSLVLPLDSMHLEKKQLETDIPKRGVVNSGKVW